MAGSTAATMGTLLARATIRPREKSAVASTGGSAGPLAAWRRPADLRTGRPGEPTVDFYGDGLTTSSEIMPRSACWRMWQ